MIRGRAWNRGAGEGNFNFSLVPRSCLFLSWSKSVQESRIVDFVYLLFFPFLRPFLFPPQINFYPLSLHGKENRIRRNSNENSFSEKESVTSRGAENEKVEEGESWRDWSNQLNRFARENDHHQVTFLRWGSDKWWKSWAGQTWEAKQAEPNLFLTKEKFCLFLKLCAYKPLPVLFLPCCLWSAVELKSLVRAQLQAKTNSLMSKLRGRWRVIKVVEKDYVEDECFMSHILLSSLFPLPVSSLSVSVI